MKTHKPFTFKCEEIRYYYNKDLIWFWGSGSEVLLNLFIYLFIFGIDLIWYSEFGRLSPYQRVTKGWGLSCWLLPQHFPLVSKRKCRSALFHKGCRSEMVGILQHLSKAPVCAFSWNYDPRQSPSQNTPWSYFRCSLDTQSRTKR